MRAKGCVGVVSKSAEGLTAKMMTVFEASGLWAFAYERVV